MYCWVGISPEPGRGEEGSFRTSAGFRPLVSCQGHGETLETLEEGAEISRLVAQLLMASAGLLAVGSEIIVLRPAEDTGKIWQHFWPEGYLGKVHTSVGPCPFPEVTLASGRRACPNEREAWGSLWEGHDIVVHAVSQLLSGTRSGREAETAGPGQLEIDLLDMSMLSV